MSMHYISARANMRRPVGPDRHDAGISLVVHIVDIPLQFTICRVYSQRMEKSIKSGNCQMKPQSLFSVPAVCVTYILHRCLIGLSYGVAYRRAYICTNAYLGPAPRQSQHFALKALRNFVAAPKNFGCVQQCISTRSRRPQCMPARGRRGYTPLKRDYL